MDEAILALIILFVPLSAFCFRFQRTTLMISRLLRTNVQLALSPTWLGNLGWASTGIGITAGILLWMSRGFWWAVGWWIAGAVGLALIDFVSPFPSYSTCFRIIKANLKRDIAASDGERRDALTELLVQVEQIEAERL